MDEQPILPEISVAEVLREAGNVGQVFLRHRTACVGCSLARFCSLRDVAETYGLSLEGLIQELRESAHPRTSLPQRSNP